MAHKGYTLNYFIDFFKNIPDHRWTTGTLQVEGTVQLCALGHCLANQNASQPDVINLLGDTNAKTEALEGFLNHDTALINDGDTAEYRALGSTPRGRILRALRNRKRIGTVVDTE